MNELQRNAELVAIGAPVVDLKKTRGPQSRAPDRKLWGQVLRSMQRLHPPIVLDYDPARQDQIERVLRHEGLL